VAASKVSKRQLGASILRSRFSSLSTAMASKGVEETSKSTQLLNGDDWRQWDPDALFQKLTISEVKRTHSKLRYAARFLCFIC
jgi:hypothetical protein